MKSTGTIHEARLDDLIDHELRRRPADFGSLVRALPGIYPGDVMASLARLLSRSAITGSELGRLLAPVHTSASRDDSDGCLPPPHPLDFDWRFDDPTAAWLAGRAEDLAMESPIALLGVPSIARHLSPRMPVTLLDSNARVVQAVEDLRPTTTTTCTDITNDSLPSLQAHVVVADPPWYPTHLRSFVWAASRLSAMNGTLLLGLPPIELRPGLRMERAKLLTWARECGFQFVEAHAGRLRYLSPPFERNAFRAAGLPSVPVDWRVGDLLIFRLVTRRDVRRPAGPQQESWIDLPGEYSSVRFRRLRRRPAVADPRLVTIVDGDILPTVSRRDGRRSRVMVWTAGNRVFGCLDPELAAAVAVGIVSGQPIASECERILGHSLTPSQRRRVAVTTMQLNGLLAIERAERLRIVHRPVARAR